ncbi:hypothetical protein ABKS89_24545 [Pseudomonas sp. LABIM340]|uniref:Uncharacterized protein n=1 Tax=Pseudomonas nitroreducens TaxID=46680 RepID=A0A5R8ZQP9_PSENT|nr:MULTISPECIES: hypothetical protein [Pseudomonas]MBD9684191.1 hypothetical protein [Pseudomonas sp. PDM20]TLP68590.1 hypothetical protein FEA48_29525 [Pseudomonas nitroreducens]
MERKRNADGSLEESKASPACTHSNAKDGLIHEARLLILAYRIGAAPLAALIAWADEKILEWTEPPGFVIDLALGMIPEVPQELDVKRNRVSSLECSQLILGISDELSKGRIDLNEFGRRCYELALITNGRNQDLLHWISDELYLCNEGIKSFQESEESIRSAISEVAAASN